MSIGKAQAAAIADGFLDTLGTSDDELRPKETFTELILLAGEFIEDAQKNLNEANSNASGKLSSSLIANEPVLKGNVLSVDINMLTYGLFVNKGVKGTKGGSSKVGYAFKNDMPSKKMVDAISGWIKRGKISTSNTNSKKSISRNERKNSAIGEISKAYGVARSIKQHGIKPTGFLDKTEKTTTDKVADRLGAAFKIDIINAIT